MSVPQDQLFESALALPQPERADLAFQLLQTLTPPGTEMSAEEFGAELRERVAGYRSGDVSSFSIEEASAIVRERLAQERGE